MTSHSIIKSSGRASQARTDFTAHLRPHHPFATIGFRAGVGDVVALAVETDDEHRASVALADGLVGGENRRVSPLGCAVADALAEGAMAELVGAAKKLDGIVGVIGS